MVKPVFLPSGSGQRFCLYHPAEGAERGAVLYVHPFAEEMNKSRRMAALQARALAGAGYAVLQIDLHGCGDSSGDFGDATWASWKGDIAAAYQWLRRQTAAPLTLWGLRAGCLLAADAAVDLPESPNFIFWQPVISGKTHWQQFLRLKAISGLATGPSKGVVDGLRQTIASGLPVEIAGYTVGSALACGLEDAELLPPAGHVGRVVWLEVSTRLEAGISPAAQKSIGHWQAAGYKLDAQVIDGPAFWQTAEIEEAPALIEATLKALQAST
jgi:exosortase A-associated hydrolase 2